MDDSLWTLLKGMEDGHPYVIRVRTDLAAVVGDRSLPNLLEIRWTYFVDESHAAHGLPTQEQLEEMAAFEERIVPALEHGRHAILVSVNMRCGERRWLCYCATREQAERALNAALGGDPAFPIDLSMMPDPEWNFYRDLLLEIPR